MLQEPHHYTIKKTARYYLSGPVKDYYPHVCFVLHGYGQLVPYFLRHFEELGRKDTLFIAPEGLHRFYLNETQRRVGASWMTKEDRLNDIDDYCRYLDQLYEHFIDKVLVADTVGVFAFSQGVATGTRWLHNSRNPFDYFLNYAGTFPPDVNYDTTSNRVKKILWRMYVGREDEFISQQKFEESFDLLSMKGFNIERDFYEGPHKLLKPVLQDLFDRIIGSSIL